jgi:AmmeMemoRadiSam system protein B
MKIRKPSVAGSFYPADPEKLRKQVNHMLSFSRPERTFIKIFGLISPHAGYVYSGPTAAMGYNLLSGKTYKTVIILSPSHKEYFPGVSVFNGDYYETPLGRIPVDKEMSEKLFSGSRNIFPGMEGHRGEHAVEVQLPFLQVVLGEFSLLPAVIGDQGDMFINDLSDKLAEIVDENTMIVASSDLSHYYPGDTADKLDSIVERRILDFDYEKLSSDFNNRRCEACGGGAIVALMRTAAKLNVKNSFVLSRTNSGDVTGDYSEVVGYLSAVLYP